MTLSEIIQNEEYWHRRLESARAARQRERRISPRHAKYHGEYVRRCVAHVRDWRQQYDAWSDRYKVVAFHGEGASHFHLVDSEAGEDDQPAVIRTYRNRDDAEECARQYNRRDDIPGSLTEIGKRPPMSWNGAGTPES